MFKNPPYLGYKIKQVYNEPTKASLFLINHITMIMKIKRHFRIHTRFVKLGVNEKIVHVNEAMHSEELKSNNETIMFSSTHDIKGN